ncbi:MAG: hypothetical protein HY644_00685 [Acidobacteria bacterium]|nr:hypothetical protein [Acidobacteriota bacterium]
MDDILKAATQEIADRSLYEHEAKLFREKLIEGERISDTFKRFAEEEDIHSEIFKEIVITMNCRLRCRFGTRP